MTSLQQRLKEMSKEDFESLIDQLLQAKYPTTRIMRVEGSGGDEGIDNFEGLLSVGPAVWQDKHFPNRIQESQRKQVLKAIKAAFAKRTPRLWVLCVPINLRTTEHNWFQNAVKLPYERNFRGTKVDLMQASHIISDLLYFKTICEAFFPDAVSDVSRLRRLATNTENLTLSERAEITTEYAQQFLAEMKAIDRRFDYEVSVGGERTPRFGREPGLVIAFKKGELLTKVFARDLDAIRLNPLSFQLKLRESGVEKLREAAETGRPQQLLPGDLAGIQSGSPLVAFLNQLIERPIVSVTPQVPDPARRIPFRFVFGKGTDAKEIHYLPFRQEFFGQRQVTLKSETALPIKISLVFDIGDGATINMQPIFEGADVIDLQHVLDCLNVLKSLPYLEVHSVEFGLPIVSGEVPLTTEVETDDGLLKVIEYSVIVSKRFGVRLKLPPTITNEDLQTLEQLKRIATEEWFGADTISSRTTKDEVHEERFLSAVDSTGMLRLESLGEFPSHELFGTTINVGRPNFECQQVEIVDSSELLERYRAASYGDAVPVVWRCIGKCRYVYDVQHS